MNEATSLAYDAARSALAQQDVTLGNLRNRTTGLLTFASLIASFSTGLGLINTSGRHVFPHWGAYAALGIFVAIGLASLSVLWPVGQFMFGPDSDTILQRTKDGATLESIIEDQTALLTQGRVTNGRAIAMRMNAFRLGAGLLVAEVIILIVAFSLI